MLRYLQRALMEFCWFSKLAKPAVIGNGPARLILEKVKANIIGVVLNDAQLEAGYGYYS